MIIKLNEQEAATLKRQLAKLKPHSQNTLRRMINAGQAVVEGDKIRIKRGYESLALAFEFV